MDQESAGHTGRRASLVLPDMQEIVPEHEQTFSTTTTTPGKSSQGHNNSKAASSTTPSGFTQGTFHNYPEEDKIATNIYATLPSASGLRSIPNPEGYIRRLEISQNIYRTTPNGVRVKFADGSTQLQFPGRLYQSDICGLERREKVSSQECTRYNAGLQVTRALFGTPIRYPIGGQPNYDNVFSSPPNKQIHRGRNTLIVQCAVASPIGAIYFGPNSRHNRTYIDPNPPRDGHLLGTELDVVKHTIRLARETAINLSKGNKAFTKIVVMTSSERVVRGITEFLSHWRRMNWWGLDLLFFPEVEDNKERWETLDQAIGRGMEDGVEVDLWLVPEEEIRGAIDLAERSRGFLFKKKVQNSPERKEPALVAKEGLENQEK
ncbi:hypothetical protein HOY80DRAFT_1138544 [Tuber brumale]|nr:hypothetical protein HOY80DRAFT_1138544 [Tuber brumale]